MTYLKALLARTSGMTVSLLVHGALAAVACVSLTRVQGGSWGGGRGEGGLASELPGLNAGFHEEKQFIDGQPVPDRAQFGPVADSEPVEIDLSRPPIPFDAFTVDVQGETLPVPDLQVPTDPPAERFAAEIRGARLPNSSSAAATGETGRAGGAAGQTGPVGPGQGSGSSAGSGDGKGDATDAVLVYAPQNYEYPREARRHSIEGEVVVEISIRVDGTCTVNRIVQSSGSSIFDDAIHRMISEWKYKPATQGGRPVPTLDRVRFRFQLTK
jgi:TonB family protein